MVQLNTITPMSTFPRPKQNPKYSFYALAISFSSVIAGLLFGYDTGIVSSALLFVPKNSAMKPMNKWWQESIVAVTPGFAAIGSIIAGPSSDAYGRKKVIIISSFVFTVGAVFCGVAIEKFMLLFGRSLLGLAIGISSSVVPMYIGETSPTNMRGQLITFFQLMITFGLLSSNIIAAGLSYLDAINVGWRLMMGVAAIPAAIQFVLFFNLPESPRWLYLNSKTAEARQVLDKIYSSDLVWVNYEINEIDALCKEEEKTNQSNNGVTILARVFTTPHVRKAFLIGCTLQAFQQFSGINTIMYYTGKIVQASGVGNEHNIIWISAGISGVNFLFTFIPVYLIEKVGRRILLIISILGVFMMLFFMAGSFYAINLDSSPSLSPAFPLEGNDDNKCFGYRNCDYCVTDENCGFCQPVGGVKGFCLPISTVNGMSTLGPCTNTSSNDIKINSKYSWKPDFCNTKFTMLPIIFMVFYLAFFSAGYAPLPWVMNAEFYPLWARSTCISLATSVNWTFNLVISLSFLSLTEAATKHGTFIVYGIITVLALLFVIFFVPETRNYNMEEVENLFMNRKEREKHEQHLHLHMITENKIPEEIKMQY